MSGVRSMQVDRGGEDQLVLAETAANRRVWVLKEDRWKEIETPLGQ